MNPPAHSNVTDSPIGHSMVVQEEEYLIDLSDMTVNLPEVPSLGANATALAVNNELTAPQSATQIAVDGTQENALVDTSTAEEPTTGAYCATNRSL